MKTKKMWGLFYIFYTLVNWLMFAYDIEYDKDFWSWMWLFNGVMGFVLILMQYIDIKIAELKNQ